MDRTFKIEEFAKQAGKAGVSDSALNKAIREVRSGLVDANLGGGVVKKELLVRERESLADFER